MRILDNKKDVKICVERFEAMISSDLFISDMFEVLDSVMYDYTRHSINDDIEPDIVSENLFYLKSLRDLFIENRTNEK